MKKQIILLITVSIFSCSYNIKYYRESIPKNRLDVNLTGNTALIRTLHADIFVKHIDKDLEKSVQNSFCFRSDDNTQAQDTFIIDEIPLDIFLIIIKNRTNKPISDINSSIFYEKKSLSPLSPELIKDEKIYPDYNGINLEKIGQYRRILTTFSEIEKVNFDKDTSLYKFKTLLPNDAIMFFNAYKTAFRNKDDYKLKISYTQENIKKVIDFDFTYFEYRTDSAEYMEHLKKTEKEKEKNLWL
ncbi:MAG: hypothetical protein JW982_06250 [Spirochaetes bacterium]|nr:hypothetical protein [Spirochaetota bacterium]